MWWFSILSLLVEVIKLLLSLRQDHDHGDLAAEFAAAKAEYKRTRDKGPLERLRDRLRERNSARHF